MPLQLEPHHHTCKRICFMYCLWWFMCVEESILTYQKGSTDAFEPALRGQGLVLIPHTWSCRLTSTHLDICCSILRKQYKLPFRFKLCLHKHQWKLALSNLLETIISVLLATQDQGGTEEQYQKTLYGIVRGVVLLMPAASSTTPHGSAPHFQNPQQMTSSWGFVVVMVPTMMMW